jgi:hypothetical protein
LLWLFLEMGVSWTICWAGLEPWSFWCWPPKELITGMSHWHLATWIFLCISPDVQKPVLL